MPRPPPRLLLDGPLAPGSPRTLDDDRAHYLRHVLRLADDDPVLVFNAEAGEWSARLHAVGRRGVAIEPLRRVRAPVAPDPLAPVLFFAPLKRDAIELVIRAATELGVGGFAPVLTARTVAGRINEHRLALIVREAAEQCERLDAPPIAAPRPLAAALDAWHAGGPARGREWGREGGRATSIAAALERAGDAAELGDAVPPFGALLIGPEGGWTDDERVLLDRHPAVRPITLGPLVLRAETAAIAGLALLRSAGRRTMHRPMSEHVPPTPDRPDDVEPG